MKKIALLSFGFIFFLAQLPAQQIADRANVQLSPAVSLSDIQSSNLSLRGPGTSVPGTAALFDVQFYYNLDSLISQQSGFAGIGWTGTEFWVSKFGKDSLFSMTAAGVVTSSFKITGVGTASSGVRSMTSDGTFFYLADNTTSIKKVDPSTKLLVSTISVASVGFNARTIAYDPNSNGGTGGFWISNFGSPLVEVDMNGNVLNSISLATHTLVGIYGLAVDTFTTGGPYLWAFDQTSTGQAANLVRLQLPTCTPTFILHNVNGDIGAISGSPGIAGGLFISDSIVTGVPTIAGVLQGTPDDLLFAYELNDGIQITDDASLDTMRWQPSFTIFPDQQVSSMTFPAIASNRGTNNIPTLNYSAEVRQGVTTLFNASGSASNIQSGSYTLVSPLGSWTPPGIGNYKMLGSVSITGFTDLNPSNDTLSFNFSVTDSIFARDNGIVNGALGIGSGLTGTLGQIFSFPYPDIITSATFRCNGPTENDTTRVVVYSFAGSAPATLIGHSDYYYFTAADTNGVELTLEIKDLSGNPLSIGSGTYYVGIEEHANNVSLATSNFNWRPNVTYISWPGQAWATNENFGFKRIFNLRVNVGDNTTSIPEESSYQTLPLYPNPATNTVQVALDTKIGSYVMTDMQGREIVKRTFSTPVASEQIDIQALETGIYQLRALDKQGKIYFTRFVKE